MSGRQRISLDPGWKFHLGDLLVDRPHDAWMGTLVASGLWNVAGAGRQLDDSAWRDVDASRFCGRA